MFAVSDKLEAFSNLVMKFENLWIYDLSHFHEHWKNQILLKKEIALGKSPWQALLHWHKLHLFSSLNEILPLARQFHRHHHHPLSAKNIRDIFSTLDRLGLQKYGHLRRLSRASIQKRFGKDWALFFEGLAEPLKATWAWKNFKMPDPLDRTHDLEEPSVNALEILEFIKVHLHQDLSEKFSSKRLGRLCIGFVHSENAEQESVELTFTHPLAWQKHWAWLMRLLEERLLALQLCGPVMRVHLYGCFETEDGFFQLSLFEKKAQWHALQELCKKLENQNISVFQPSFMPSYLPEATWSRASILEPAKISEHGLHRPLIQYEPRKLMSLESNGAGLSSRFHFSERVTWVDEKGEKHKRDYYFLRTTRLWKWVFKNEKDEWFEQGIVE